MPDWFEFILVVICYLFGSVITAWLYNRYFDNKHKDTAIAASLVWPVVWMLCVVTVPIFLLVSAVEWLAEKWEDWEIKRKWKK